MRAWDRVAVATLCGGCGRTLMKGDAVLVITRPRATGKPLRFLRCDKCEGPAPPDLPAFVERTSAIVARPLRQFTPTLPLGTTLADYRGSITKQCVDTVVTDFRARAAGEREPGEEG